MFAATADATPPTPVVGGVYGAMGGDLMPTLDLVTSQRKKEKKGDHTKMRNESTTKNMGYNARRYNGKNRE